MSATKIKWPRYRGYSRLTKAGNSGSLSVPSELMGVLTEGLLFKPELTKDGILFRITDETKIATDDKPLPAWVKAKPKPAPKAKTAEAERILSAADEPVVTDEGEVDPDLVAEADEDDAPAEDVDSDDAEPPSDDDSPF